MNKTEALKAVAKEAQECKRCTLSKFRNNVVFGAGNPDAKILFVGEAPGYNEDKKGIPFCGKAGNVLDELLLSVNLKREDIYITNIIKCRPPQNRDPEKEEKEACRSFLERQIDIINPVIIGSLGRLSLKYFLERYSFSEEGSISALHGKVLEAGEDIFQRIKIVALYHPAVAVYDPGKIGILKRDLQVFKEI